MGTFTISQEKTSVDLLIYPTGGLDACTDMTPIGDAPNYKCIDEVNYLPDDDSTYVYWNGVASGIDMYSLPSDTDFTGTVNYIQIYSKTKSDSIPQSTDGIFKICCSPNATCTELFKSADNNLTTNYQTYSYVWTKNPATDATWTLNNIKNLCIGIEASSPSVIGTSLSTTLRPNAIGDVTTLPGGTAFPHYEQVDDIIHDGYTSIVATAGVGDDYDLYNIENHTFESGVIDRVDVFSVVRTGDAPTGYNQIKIKTNGVEYAGTLHTTPETWTLYSDTWTVNPNTGNAWTWNEIDNLQVGIRLTIYYHIANAACTQVYVIVHYTLIHNPEIRTTQCFARINYVPPSDDCTLNKPEEISVDHNRNVKMLNFWDGTREVYDLSRSSKTMVLTGKEYQSNIYDKECPCERIACIRAMGKDGSQITISGLSFNLFNGDYRIRSFGWKHISEKPEYYEWILELEDSN